MIRAFAAAGAAIACVLAAASPAAAYVQYRTDSGALFHWPTTLQPLTSYPHNFGQMPVDQITNAAQLAASEWSDRACTYFQIALDTAAEDATIPRAGHDSTNNLLFRTDNWCLPQASDGSVTCYDPTALAITSVFVTKSNGQIVDADIEVNGINFMWADVDLDQSAGKQDLQNALTHEMGHFIGLDHTCYAGGPVRGVDDTGALVPLCADASQDVRDTTMFASAPARDTSKRSLAPDDERAICEIYNAPTDPQKGPPGWKCEYTADGRTCTGVSSPGQQCSFIRSTATGAVIVDKQCMPAPPPRDGGCAIAAPAGAAGGAVTAVLAAIGMWLARRRRRG